MMKHVYLGLSIIGIIVPYFFLFRIYQDTGTFDIVTFIQDGTANDSARFLVGDLSVAGLAALSFILYEGITKKIRYWWVALLGIFAVGTSFGFPFFLYLLEREKEPKKN